MPSARRTAPSRAAGAALAAAALLAATAPAATADDGPPARLTAAQLKAAKPFEGAHSTYLTRNLVVEGPDKKLTTLTLLVVRRADGTAKVIDSRGQVYGSALDDFRAHNHLLTPRDEIIAPTDLASDSAHLHLVTTTGHTPAADRTPWIAGGTAAGVLLLGGAGFLVVRRRRRRAIPVVVAPE
jgi:hypothetical protein